MIESTDTKILVRRIAARINNLDPDSKKMKAALFRIGITLQNEIRLRIKGQKLIDTGRLINSIAFELRKQSVFVGSFNVPYAAIHEFGFMGVVGVRAHRRLQGLPPREILVRSHERRMNVPARPYLRPAFESKSDEIVDIIRALVREV